MRHKPVTWCVMALALLASLPLAAQTGGVQYRFRDRLLVGDGTPEVYFAPDTDLTRLTLTFAGPGGAKLTKRYGALQAGHETMLALPALKGVNTFKAHAEGAFRDGNTLDQEFEVTTAVLEPLEITVQRQDVDLGKGTLVFSASRAARLARLDVFDQKDNRVSSEETPVNDQARGVRLRFPTNNGNIGRMVLRVWDTWDFWNEMEVKHFSIYIDHEEVEFEFGKADIRLSEEPKLSEALRRIQEFLSQSVDARAERLYVAGYTDSVGSPGDNQALSERRARSIATWFKAHGVGIPIWCQGFGETVLFKLTPDETPEPANRRAYYILGVEAPDDPANFPRANWSELK
jgi:outer membrane protein OmpA-like peptidoglycan-associated protein